MKEEEQCKLRSKLVNILTNYMQNKRFKHGKTDELGKRVIRMFDETKSFMRENPNIVVSSADKGGATVVMMKEEYGEKMRQLLADTNVYKIINRDPTKKLERQANELIKEIHQMGIIDDFEKKKLMVVGSSIPKIYGAPKTHKIGNPLRLIVASYLSPAYKISKMLADVLIKVLDVKANVKNSFDFKRSIDDVRMPEDYVLVSYDVVSLFTNVTVERINDAIKKRWPSIRKHTKIKQGQFIEMVGFCLVDCNDLAFENTNYAMVSGTMMGGPSRQWCQIWLWMICSSLYV